MTGQTWDDAKPDICERCKCEAWCLRDDDGLHPRCEDCVNAPQPKSDAERRGDA